METIIYPYLTAAFGGASSARVGKRSVWVQVQDTTYRVPLKEVKPYLDDGCKLAQVAEAWVYRSA